MRLPARIVVLVSALAACLCPAMAQEAVQVQRHVRVELLSQSAAITANQRLWLGVHFSLDPGWHIYWINPGDSGQPPVFEWQMPPGFTVGDVLWPVPEKLKSSRLADYGYQDDVVLPAPVRAAGQLKEGARVEINVLAKWLVCREVCIPEREQLHLSLPVARTSAEDQSRSRIFAAARKSIPSPWPPSWKATAKSTQDSFILSVQAGKPIQGAEFFPLEAGQIENAAPQLQRPARTGVSITLKKSDQLLKPVAVLRGVLRLRDARSFQMRAAIH